MRILCRVMIVLIAVCTLLAASNVAQARPGYGRDCKNCHAPVEDLMEVDDTGLLTDLGVQLGGQERGALKTFEVQQGKVVSLLMTVLDGSDRYAVELKRMETGGQLVSQDNLLVWSDANDAGNVWTERVDGVSSITYLTKDDNGGGIVFDGAIGYQFDMLIDISTPVDIYDLEFAIGKKIDSPFTRLYSDEHFYLSVLPVPEPSTLAMLLMASGLGVVLAIRRKRSA